MYRKVILPTDGSEMSMKGVKEGLRMAKFLDTPAVVIHVIEIGDISLTEEMEKNLQSSAMKILDQVEELAKDMGVDVEAKIMKGTPYKEISEYSEEEDVIYISSHGKSGFRDLFMGSTTDRLLKHAECTVSVVKGKPGKK